MSGIIIALIFGVLLLIYTFAVIARHRKIKNEQNKR